METWVLKSEGAFLIQFLVFSFKLNCFKFSNMFLQLQSVATTMKYVQLVLLVTDQKKNVKVSPLAKCWS